MEPVSPHHQNVPSGKGRNQIIVEEGSLGIYPPLALGPEDWPPCQRLEDFQLGIFLPMQLGLLNMNA